MMIHKVLQILREESHISQKQVALSGGISRNTVRAVELGNGEPTLKTLRAYAQALDCHVADIFNRQKSLESPVFRQKNTRTS